MDMKDYSQNGEQPVILETLAAIGIEKGHLVDLGAGDGVTMSNSRALLEKGWTGDLYDGDPKGAKDVKQAWITADYAFAYKNFPVACDFLNIDLDGNDYHILHSFLGPVELDNKWFPGPKPALIVAEINPIFQRDEAVVMPYNEGHVWNNDTYYGMSLAAAEQLGKQYGYTLMHLHAGINAFLLRNDHAKAHPELIRPIEYRQKFDHKPHPSGKPWTTLS